jgi:hypothetical protein
MKGRALPRKRALRCWLPAGLLIVGSLALAACGSSSKKTSSSTASGSGQPSVLSLSITETGQTAKYTAPTSIAGGLVNLQLTNRGQAPHAAQLIRIDAPHTLPQAEQALGSNSNKTPAWIHFAGGLGRVPPGPPARAFVNLPPGQYIVADFGGPGNGQPAIAQLTVTPGHTGSLPTTPTTVTAANPSKDHYKWQISGPLKAGTQLVTFDSKGSTAQHLMAGALVTGNPSTATIIATLKKRTGSPPPFVDPSTIFGSASLDGGSAQVTPLTLSKPGTYVLFCPLSDRDGGKQHFEEGMLTRITVK